MEQMGITDTERENYAKSLFYSLKPLKMKVYSSKFKKKLVSLELIAAEFEAGRSYSESEVNEILAAVYEDFATIRRALVDYHFLERTKDCSSYCLVEYPD